MRILILLALFLLPLPGRAATFHIEDQAGFDQAIYDVQAGDQLIVAPGSYHFPQMRASGTSGQPIIVQAEKSAIHGGKTIITNHADIRGDHIKIQGFLFKATKKTFEALKLFKSHHIEITENVIDHFSTDYGIRIHSSSHILIHDNFIEGQYNHAISSKELVDRMRVINNHFRDCGSGCIESGQSPDGTNGPEQTSTHIEITGNFFEGVDTKRGKKFKGIGIKIKNARETLVKNNSFTGKWRFPVQTSFGSVGPKAKSRLGHFGNRFPEKIDFISNDFGTNGALDLSGRGHKGDVFLLKDNKGSVRCKVNGFRTHGGPIKKLIDRDTIDDVKPEIVQSGNSFQCK